MKAATILISAIIIIAIVFAVVYSADQKRDATARNQQQNQTTPPVTTPEPINQTIPTNQTNTIPLPTLRKHSTQQDCWIGYQGKAYDITAWLPKHPGSAAAIAPYCGTAAEFEEAFKDQHGTSQVAKLVREGIFKGDIV